MRSIKAVTRILPTAFILVGCTHNLPAGTSVGSPPVTFVPGVVQPFVSTEQAYRAWAAAEARQTPPRVTVRGIYLTPSSASNPAKLTELLDLVKRTELNAMVVDVKDDWGKITFATDHPITKQLGAVSPDLKGLRALTALLRSKSIYSIARIVCFKDAFVPKHHQDLAIRHTGGGVWRDYNGVTWLDPFSKGAWDYLVDIAQIAALSGFDEIQFDYVRFPTDGNLNTVDYFRKDSRKREQVIAEFLAYARKELRPYRVWISADVFGLVTSTPDDMGIGQRLEEISEAVDYVSPMVYPSHYAPGNLGVSNPNAMPYQTVYRSMLDAKNRWAKAGQTDRIVMRPWLQDFSWGYSYGPEEVKAQIQATYDAGFTEWLLWNTANLYTEAALKPVDKTDE